MKKQITYIAAILFMATFFTGCGSKSSTEVETTEKGQVQVEEELSVEGEVHLSELKKNSIGIKVDVIPTRPLSGVVEANGQLEVPPQHEATVTAILGANVTAIKVIEGDKVKTLAQEKSFNKLRPIIYP